MVIVVESKYVYKVGLYTKMIPDLVTSYLIISLLTKKSGKKKVSKFGFNVVFDKILNFVTILDKPNVSVFTR